MRHRVDLVHHLHGVGQQIVERVGAAAIGHVQDVDAGPILEHLDAQVGGGAEARRAVGELAGVRLGVVDHLLEGLGADGGMDDEPADEVADARHRHEALDGVVGRLAQVRQDVERRVGRQQEGVAVGRRLGGGLGADHAAGTAAVLDDELLAEGLAQLFRPGPADQVGGAARRIGQDELDGLVGPALRLGRGRSRSRPPALRRPSPEIRDDAFKILPEITRRQDARPASPASTNGAVPGGSTRF